ncbi:GNAT family N-acetyltransferase [Parasphingopyxis sp. GrpM-11]|uniref:GNAT family N-acetyltransferase n=1 Tax=Parasphingopyxis marina TaxID=2761622 RepID=A0A842HT35_9SPHN|nr:GNAT family N-acetyltransferase [Parasphingopyxis marina]
MRIRTAETPSDIATIAELFRAYAASLDVDLDYQDFASELAGLPGAYSRPRGALLLAETEAGTPSGCAALRPLRDEGCCEMKRLYVVPESRGTGLGRNLMAHIVETARTIGYREMRLDTLSSMVAAQAMYRDAGFKPCEPYYAGAPPGTVFLSLRLGGTADA